VENQMQWALRPSEKRATSHGPLNKKFMNIHEGNNSHILPETARCATPLRRETTKKSGKNRKVNENKNEILQTAADFHWKVFSEFLSLFFRLKRNKILGLNSSAVV
jgi:hypothetical protein